MRSVELRACLDPGYTVPDKLANNFSGNELKEWVMDRFDYRESVSEADLITLNICANDIAAYALFYARGAMNGEGVSNAVIEAAIGSLEKCGEYSAALAKLLELGASLGSYVAAAKAAVNGLYIGYNRWIENWDAIIGIIYELNPDVTLICVGMNNPFNHLKITKDSSLEIGKAADGLVQLINYWSAVGSAYSDKYIYVDTMGIETICEARGNTLTDEDFLNHFELNVHPSLKGQQQIAQRIVNALSEHGELPCTAFISQFRIMTRNIINKYGAQFNRIIGSYIG